MKNWLSKSGGLFYHYKSLRFQKSLWLPFRRELESFFLHQLEQIPSSQRKNLILVGASGGHCLPDSFLEKFENIHHIDIDPASRCFFRWRHPRLKVNFLNKDIFDFTTPKFNSEKFNSENSTWIWCNLLGQLGLLESEPEVEKKMLQVKTSMAGRTWFSFHDLYSFTSQVPFARLPLKTSYENWREVAPDLTRLHLFKLELRDHLTDRKFSFLKKRVMVWPLTPFEIHFVECGFTSSSEPLV